MIEVSRNNIVSTNCNRCYNHYDYKERAVSDLREYTVIVADDEQMISNGISRMISQECDNTRVVATCYDGAEVIRALKEEPVDLVITDICMPETDGLQIAEYIHKTARYKTVQPFWRHVAWRIGRGCGFVYSFCVDGCCCTN